LCQLQLKKLEKPPSGGFFMRHTFRHPLLLAPCVEFNNKWDEP
jgi:hypothetical protein